MLLPAVTIAGGTEGSDTGQHSFSGQNSISGSQSLSSHQASYGQHWCSHHSSGPLNFSTYVKDPGLLLYDVRHYEISLQVNDTSTYIRGYTEILASALENIPELVVELSEDLEVDSIFLNEIPAASYSHSDDLIRILPEKDLLKAELFSVKVFYQGSSGGRGFYSGLSNRLDVAWNIPVTYTLSEPFRASDWYVCKQVLTDKADSADIYITVEEGLMAGSNGLLQGIDSLPGNKLRYHWYSGYPIAYYLLSLSVSEYQDYSFYARSPFFPDSLLVQNFIYDRPGYLFANKEDIDITEDLLDLYSGLMTPYPFPDEKYGHCVAPMGGGMEHQTMTTLSSFNLNLVAHELTHQWFGDNVTCASWQDIWINEGFASYGEYLALENLRSVEEARYWMNDAHGWALSEPEGSVFIPEQDAWNPSRIFSRALSYKKGAALIHMLRYELNDDPVFFQTLSDFQNLYADSVATGDDFLSVLNETSGKDFNWFFQQWYYGQGFPMINIYWWQDNENLNFEVYQQGSSGQTPFFRTGIDLLVQFENGMDTLVRINIDDELTVTSLRVDGMVSGMVVDPHNWVLEQSEVLMKSPPNSQFSVNPNPFSDTFNIVFNGGSAKRDIVLTDLSGKVLKRKSSRASSLRLNADDLAQGVYLLNVSIDKESYTTRVIKQ
jgi:aminopeptidase N